MKFVDKISKEEYSNFVMQHKTSHFLKSYEWGQISRKRGLIPHYVGIRQEGKLVATALLLQKKLPFGQSYFYIPRGYTIDYDNRELTELFTKEIAKFAKRKKAFYFKIDPDIKLHTIDENASVVPNECNNYELVKFFKTIGFHHKKLNLYFENMQPRFTFRIPVNQDMENIQKKYSKSVIRWIKKANKYNVNVSIGSKEDLSEFIRLMKLTEKRQGFFSHEYDFYPYLYDVFSKSNSVSLMLATIDIPYVCSVLDQEITSCTDEIKKEKLIERKNLYLSLNNNKNKRVVSSYINIHYGNKSWYLYGANDMNFKDTFANYKLFDFQIKQAHDIGIEIFDEFGTIGAPHSTKSVAGLHEFKKKFGGEYTEFIGEFDYILNPFIYFVFNRLVPLYRKPLKFLRHLKVKFQKGSK